MSKMSTNYFNTLLGVDKEQELLQSFIRVGLTTEEEAAEEARKAGRRKSRRYTGEREEREERRVVKFTEVDEKGVPGGLTRGNRIEYELRAQRKRVEEQQQKRKKAKENFIDFYTDKDRAAAVTAGAFDIKQSLQIKQKRDRIEAALVPDESDSGALIALGLKEIKNANPENAIIFFTKALDINRTDINALISRSKCYLQLGEASKALEDAETALAEEKTNIRALFQKAESLYFLGQFEQSLMYFHRGLRARPEMHLFRLGVQKTQEAIENTIGGTSRTKSATKGKKKRSGEITPKSQSSVRTARPKLSQEETEKRNARKLLGELSVDKEYLLNLLKHPDLKRADSNTENISTLAQEAVDFLNKRQEFWRQQSPKCFFESLPV